MKTKRNGFTLVELLIVIVVIGVLSAMMMLSSSESVSTAKATNIINNLQILERATVAWYADNRDKVLKDGTVKIGNATHPIQEWKDKDLKLSKYITNTNGAQINLNTTVSVTGTNRKNTELGIGCYGVCDGGTDIDENGNQKTDPGSWHRKVWYVGYRFTEGEDAVREKIRGRLKSSGLVFGTADAHLDPKGNNDAAVWLRVF